MSVGERTHYLTFRSGMFCTVSDDADSIPIKLFERVSADGYPTSADYVYIPADTFEAGKQYLLVQRNAIGLHTREALSHDADRLAHETVTIYSDDVYGDFITDEVMYENAVWLTSDVKTDGLKIVNNHYYTQVDDGALVAAPLANGNRWTDRT